MSVRAGSQCGRVLAVLADGRWHPVPEVHRRAGTMRLNSRVAELRKHGYGIECGRVPGRRGAAAYRYRLVSAPPAGLPAGLAASLSQRLLAEQEDAFTLPGESVAPRDGRERFRIYRYSADALLELVATCASPEAVGVTLCTLGAEGEWRDSRVGVLDSNGKEGMSGGWLINPWDGR